MWSRGKMSKQDLAKIIAQLEVSEPLSEEQEELMLSILYKLQDTETITIAWWE